MKEVDRKLSRQTLITRAQVLDVGGSDDTIAARLEAGWWEPFHPGVYRRGPRSGQWHENLGAALLAAGPEAKVSHRAAFALWGLEGLNAHLVELTVPYTCGPIPAGVILHRTRRPMPGAVVDGLGVTTVERALLDCAPLVPRAMLSRGVDSAVRRGLTDGAKLARLMSEQGGRGVRGTRKLAGVVADLEATGPTGSPAEVDALDAMRAAGLPLPVPQYEIVTPSGRRYRVDFGWPRLGKAVEIDGLDAHTGATNLERDLRRQNDLLDTGIELRRFTAWAIRNNIDEVVAAIRRFLET